MNEYNPDKYQWFIIPGFRGYDININTKEIRSNKHFNKDPHHIMKVSKSNTVCVTDDYGKSRRVDVDDLYIETFNKGKKLEYRADNWSHMGGMQRLGRTFDIKMDFSKYVEKQPSNYNIIHDILIKPLYIDK